MSRVGGFKAKGPGLRLTSGVGFGVDQSLGSNTGFRHASIGFRLQI